MLNHSIIQKAFIQNSPFEISFYLAEKLKGNYLRCSFIDYRNHILILELNKAQTLGDECIAMPAFVFFSVYNNNKMECYTFISNIIDIIRQESDVCKIILSFPSKLENSQRRRFFRVPVTQKYVLAAAMWRNKAIPLEKDLSITRLPDPELVFLPKHTLNFSLVDISVGGIRFRVSRKTMYNYSINYDINDYFLLKLSLYDTEDHKQIRLLLRCQARNIKIHENSKNVHVGLQYESWKSFAESSISPKIKKTMWLALFSESEKISIRNIELQNSENQKRQVDMIGNHNMRNINLPPQPVPNSETPWVRLGSFDHVEPLGKWIMQEQIRSVLSQDSMPSEVGSLAPAM